MTDTSGYIDVPIVTDPDEMIQDAFQGLADNLPGWLPREGNLEVALLEQAAVMAAEAATAASAVPKGIFRFFGQLVGIVPNPGVTAVIATTWTLAAPAGVSGYAIPDGTVAGFYYQSGGYQYQIPAGSNFVIASGQTSGVVLMEAVEPGSAYNVDTILGANATSTYLDLLNPNQNIVNIKITGTPAQPQMGYTAVLGTDPETDTSFLNRLSAELQQLAPRPITPNDFAQMAQNVPGVYRALVLDGLDAYTNLMSVADANCSNATGWLDVGNVTHTGSHTVTGGQAVYTTYNGALPSGISMTTVAAGATSVIAGSSLGGTPSTGTPMIVLVTDATNGNEIIVLESNPSGTTYGLAGDSSFQYAHTGGVATLTVLQGIKFNQVPSLASNTAWYAGGAEVLCGSDTTGTATPYLVNRVTYEDGSVSIFSSCNPWDSAQGFDYTAQLKLVRTRISTNDPDALPLAPGRSASGDHTYDSIATDINAVDTFVVWSGATANTTHKVLYTSLTQVPYDFGGEDGPIGTGVANTYKSNYNKLPDAHLIGAGNAAASSWTLPSGVSALPGLGLQLPGFSGATLGSTITAISPVFRVAQKVASGAVNQTYTVLATINATSAGETYADITVQLYDVKNATVLGSASPTSASLQTISFQYTASAPLDVEVRIVFNTALVVALNTSVLIYAMGVYEGAYTPSALPSETAEDGWYWSPGGLYTPGSFNAPRSVVLAPCDPNGLPVTHAIGDSLSSYLESYREVNFDVEIIKPNYVAVDVEWGAVAKIGYDVATVQAAGNAAIYAFLSPATWGGGNDSPPFWDPTRNSLTILDIANVLATVPGLALVTSIQIAKSAVSGAPGADSFGTTPITFPGIAPMPIGNYVTGTVAPNALDASLGSI